VISSYARGSMRQTTLGQLDVILAGGPDRMGGGDGPMLVLMHGFGAPGGDLVSLHRSLRVPPEVRFAFPRAPLDLAPGTPPDFAPRAWWMIDIPKLQADIQSGRGEERVKETPEGLEPAREAVYAMLAALEKDHAAPPERVVLGGFSQGSMLACDVLLRHERRFAGAVLLSSTVICGDEWTKLAPARKGVPVLQSHGRADPVLPYAGGERLRDLLIAAGLEVEWLTFAGGHGVPDSVVNRLGDFVLKAAANG
jgi:phospholipase/carboxylesterase